METTPNRYELIGYLEEALPSEQMARIEERLRQSETWRAALRELSEEMVGDEHSLATIWRRHRLTCVSREKLGAFLMGGLVPDEADYIKFHLEIIQCRWCLANMDDVQSKAKGSQPSSVKPQSRSRRFFETSVGYLPGKAR